MHALSPLAHRSLTLIAIGLHRPVGTDVESTKRRPPLSSLQPQRRDKVSFRLLASPILPSCSATCSSTLHCAKGHRRDTLSSIIGAAVLCTLRRHRVLPHPQATCHHSELLEAPRCHLLPPPWAPHHRRPPPATVRGLL
jgi:hypothetical protein